MTSPVACEKNINITGSEAEVDKEEKVDDVPRTQGYHVSKELAIYAAKEFANAYGFQIGRLLNGKKIETKMQRSIQGYGKAIKHVLRLYADGKKAALYLINYNGGGFAIVSGDKRVNPILALKVFCIFI